VERSDISVDIAFAVGVKFLFDLLEIIPRHIARGDVAFEVERFFGEVINPDDRVFEGEENLGSDIPFFDQNDLTVFLEFAGRQFA